MKKIFIGVWAAFMVFIIIGCGDTNLEGAAFMNKFTFTAVQYKIVQPDGTTIILRSRGAGSDADKAYFDIFIEDGAGGVEAFLANPVWHHFDSITAENAVNHSAAEGEVRGLFVGAGGDRNRFFLDINGGSDMGGVTYRIITGAFGEDAAGCLMDRPDGTPIHIDTEQGGNIDTGLRNQWDGVFENTNGAIFFNGARFVTNDTAAHAYFTDLRTGLRLKEHNVTMIGSTDGSQGVQPGYTLTRSTFTYTAKKASGGVWIKDLGSSYPVSFNIEFTDGAGTIQEMRFFPAITSVK